MEAHMKDFSRNIWFVLALVLGFTAAAPVHAQISVELAKKCRSLMIKAHPTELYGATGSAAAQRAYYQKCISQQGQMPEAAQGTTTGQGN
jgi:hypothetical protein